MSHKRPTKRSRTSTAEYSSHLSPSSESFQPKRSKLDDEGSVRRSSRAPKPKVFDDEFIDTLHSSLDDNGKKEKPVSPTMDISFDAQTHGCSSNIFYSDSSKRRKSARAPKPKSFDEHFVDSSISKHDFRTPSEEFIPKSPEGSNTFGRTSAKHKSKGKEEKQERSNSKNSVGQGLDYDDFTMVKPPKGNQKGKKSSEKPSYYETYLQQAAHGQYFTQPYTSSYNVVDNVNINDSPKVRQSSRTPKPKKMFSLIEDSTYVSSANDNNNEGDTLICNISNESATTKSGSKSSKKYSHRQSLAEALDVPLEHSKKKAKGKNESSSDEKHSKKSKKSKTDSDLLWNPAFSTKAVYDVMGEHSESKKDSKGRKEKVRSSSSKEVKEDTSAVDVNVKSMSGENCQAKKKLKKKSELKDKELSSSPFFEKTHSKPSAVEHGKKSHPKHSKTKHDEPHSETKDKDQHIILKVHLPQSPSHHLHSHKKHHKHKHHSSESKEGSSSETKTKKPRLSMDGSLSVSSDDTPKKKLSIKFKGLSSSEPDVEVDVESPFSSPSLEKAAANPEKKKKVKKQSQDSVMAPTIPMEDNTQQHVKVVIKKKNEMEKKVSEKSENKQVKSKAKESKLVSSKTPTKEKESKVADPKSQKSHHKVTVAGSIAKAKSVVHGSGGKVKVSEVKPEEKKKSAVPAAKSKTSSSEERPKSSPKKKSKGGGTPGKSPEKKKSNISGYILFCKSERHNIAEANPGLDFPQVSQKVGEAWNSLSDVQKQKWKDKANAIKAKLNLNVEKKDKNQESSSPDVVDMAAHLKLLGESLVLIGTSLKAQRGAEVHGSLSVLLDSILCAICPLTFLTSHIPGIPGVSKEKQIDILDDLAYTMPGLG